MSADLNFYHLCTLPDVIEFFELGEKLGKILKNREWKWTCKTTDHEKQEIPDPGFIPGISKIPLKRIRKGIVSRPGP